jgi:pimeloyl-ACP methyl ester carboxylesterase
VAPAFAQFRTRHTTSLSTALLAVGLIAGLLVGATGPAGTSWAAGPSLAWHRCDVRYRCTELQVPLDYADPGEGTLGLALAELPATGGHVLGDLVINPGGPGASGVQFLENTTLPAELRASFNLVSFDPRGIGQSDPVTCVGPATVRALVALDPDPVTGPQVASVVDATKAFVRDCAQRSARPLLQHVGSLDTVRDLDRIRAALGQAKLNYLGFSYGTYLGELYAQAYPSHVRAMVLDGVVDPDLSYQATVAGQAEGFELNLKAFFAWCPHDKACARELPQGARAGYDKLFEYLDSGGHLVAQLRPKYGGTQAVTAGVAESALVGTLYSDQTWSLLAQAISQGLAGDGGLLAALAYSFEGLQGNGQYANLLAASTAIECLDRPYPRQVKYYQTLAVSLVKLAPDFGAVAAWNNLACAFWPVPPEGQREVVRAPLSPPLLLIGSTGDPATPYSWAQAMSRQLAHAVLLTRVGPGHTGYLYSACAQRWTDRYLDTLALPPPGTVCTSSS